MSFLSISAPLRALYLGDNEFEVLPPEIKNLVNLQVVNLKYILVFLFLIL